MVAADDDENMRLFVQSRAIWPTKPHEKHLIAESGQLILKKW